jgi:hypothetical protein
MYLTYHFFGRKNVIYIYLIFAGQKYLVIQLFSLLVFSRKTPLFDIYLWCDLFLKTIISPDTWRKLSKVS